MQFYRIDIILERYDQFDDRHIVSSEEKEKRIDIMNQACETAENFSERISDTGYIFVSNFNRGKLTLGMIVCKPMDVYEFINEFTEAAHLNICENVRIFEILLRDFESLLDTAERYAYIFNHDEVLERFGLDNLIGSYTRRYIRASYDEKIIHLREKPEIYECANEYYAKKTLISELDRIFVDTKTKKVYGHPVHYMIEADDEMTQKGVGRLLIQSLKKVGRVNNLRYCEVTMSSEMNFNSGWMESMYKTCVGGTMILFFGKKMDDNDTDELSGNFYYLENLCKIIKCFCLEVLTIICLPKECTTLRMKIFENIGNCSFVEIKEEFATYEEAVDYLKECACEFHIRPDKSLFSSLAKDQLYQIKELKQIFDEWYSVKLKSTVYKQYKDIAGAKSFIEHDEIKGSAYDELMSMIGLKSAKDIINKALDSYKAQRLFKDKGMPESPFCNHMIFTGNPGTAKTSVARLFAKILRENDVISRGHIVEVGRGDLVGQFVGWTAPTIKRKFKEAVGGILFIDEAYSLVDGRNGSFGDEAINTIVQEMENHRDEVIVIFAGYPDKMQGFLDKNPGLRSRIAHYVHFEDYNTDELCQIANYIASKNGLVLEGDAITKIEMIMDQARKDSDFGNGRYARNLIEKARMAQNSRLVHMNYEDVSVQDIKVIKAEDIEIPQKNNKEHNKIGFAIA